MANIKVKEIKPIESLLVANRGEIASRVFRTCRKMGIRSVAVFSEADRHMPFVGDADEAVFIGENAPSESYLNMDKIISVAKQKNIDAIHPGYGFLSENAAFAQKCIDNDIIFVGPHPDAISSMGSKATAKALMQAHDVPVVPGYNGDDQDMAVLMAEAKGVGVPLLLKAAAGGGGKGMRIVRDLEDLEQAIRSAQRESLSAFGDDRLIIEKYIESGRHIEFQIIGDKHGHVLHLLERECSLQRRYQKVIEESPSPVMTEPLRKRMGAAAIKAAKAIQYDNAGTMEFIYDKDSDEFYFLEVNTRLQVEHPVTEAITGLDIVQLQIESAEGKPLSLYQEDISGSGYAVEVRLYAEDAGNNFTPVTGRIVHFEVPHTDGLRVESAIRSGSDISVFYDPMIAKIIVHGSDRSDALRKMAYVLRRTICLGTVTNQDYLLRIVEDQRFIDGAYTTQFLNKDFGYSRNDDSTSVIAKAAIAATLYGWRKRNGARKLLKSLPSGWRNSFYAPQHDTYFVNKEMINVQYRYQSDVLSVSIGEQTHKIRYNGAEGSALYVEIDDMVTPYYVINSGQNYFVHSIETGNLHLTKQDRLPVKEKEAVPGVYASPMPCTIVKLNVKPGQRVKSGDALIIISSMKMESIITATSDGIVEETYVADNQSIEAGMLMLKINEKDN